MIIEKGNKSYRMNSLYTNENYTDLSDSAVYVVDETLPENRALVQKIVQNAPYIDFVEDDGQLVDVVVLPQPEPEPPPPSQEERLAALEAAMLEMILGGGE